MLLAGYGRRPDEVRRRGKHAMRRRIQGDSFRILVDLESLFDCVGVWSFLPNDRPAAVAVGYENALRTRVINDTVGVSANGDRRHNLAAIRIGHRHDLVSAAAEQAVGRFIYCEGSRSIACCESDQMVESHPFGIDHSDCVTLFAVDVDMTASVGLCIFWRVRKLDCSGNRLAGRIDYRNGARICIERHDLRGGWVEEHTFLLLPNTNPLQVPPPRRAPNQ